MRGHTRRLVAAGVAAAVLLAAAGCGSAEKRTGRGEPRVRIQGAKILEADPEHRVEQGALPRALQNLPSRIEAAVPAGGIPEGIAPDVPPSTVDLVDTPVSEALRGLAYQGGVDMILAEGLDRKVSVHLENASWAEAFEAILDAAHLVSEWEGRRVRILTPEQLKTQREAVDSLERQSPQTEVHVLHNLLAEDAKDTLETIISGDGKMGIDKELNAVVVTDTSSRLRAVRHAVASLDQTPPQVMIEAMIIDVVLTDALSYGWDWTVMKQVGDTMNWAQRLTVGAGLNAAAAPGGRIGFGLTRRDWTINGVWDFIETHDNTKVLANPKILAVNNREASIEIIEEIPYQELTQTSDGGQIGTTAFKEVGVKLVGTPRIAADGTIHLDLRAEQSNPTGAAINQIPVIQTRKASTVMTVQSGQTIVIGGLRRRREITNEDKMPLIGDIPGLGGLFRRVVTTEVDTELVIFITPHVVYPNRSLTAREEILTEALDHLERRPMVIRTDPLRLFVGKEEDRARRVP